MGRKRLLTILATVAAAVSLQVGPAAAQSLSVPGVGDVNVGSDECLEVGVDISLSDALKLDPSVCISEDGVEVDGGAKALKDKVEADAGQATKPVQQATETAAKSAKKASGSSNDDSSDGGSSGGSTSGSGSGETAGSGSTSTSSTSGSNGSNVAASGDAPEPVTSTAPASRQAQLGALMAIRNELAAGPSADRGVAGPVQTFGGLATTGDLAAPQVADSAEVVPGVDEQLAPEVAPSSEQQEAVFASTTPMRDLAEAPLALQLLAAALVLGAAAVWTIAAREYGGKDQTTTA